MADITTLQQSLINAKRVMSKVDGGNFTKSGIELPSSTPTSNINMDSVQQHLPPQSNITESMPTQPPNLNPKANMNEEKIKSSNLPQAIKEAMISTPIPDIPFNGGGVGLSEDFLNNVKTEMNKQGMSTSHSNVEPQQSILTVPPIKTQTTKKITSKNLKSIIKESVKELIDETIGLKTDNEENFQFRVGNKIFYGKITSSKNIK